MLTLKESTLVLAKIRVHHGNAAITDLEARTFHEELRADMTLGEALEAVKRFYAANDSGRWCGSGDVNAMVRRMRNESKPSEAQIAAECEARHLAEDAAWMYRRQRMLGNTPQQAQQQALTARNPFELPPADRNRIWYMSGKDRANNRSKTPLGFARAVYEVNQGKATEE